MASNSLTDRDPAFNQSSLSEFQLSEIASKLELAVSLLAKNKALFSVALRDGLLECTDYEQHNYLATMDEMNETAADQLDEALVELRSDKKAH